MLCTTADPEDGLISAGEKGFQLTWMDAKVDDWVVTPREGKPVEINALWYNSLKIFEMLGEKFGSEVHEYSLLARQVKTSFRKAFWNNQSRCLYDNIQPNNEPDVSIRPNQIFSVFLPFSILEPFQESAIVDVVFKHLYTSMGLRSLSPEDPKYVGKYSGGRKDRDGAYH
ncbi:glycogen debranching protein, partial [bacterium]|nr:glycogen debranching protein [bacterium]